MVMHSEKISVADIESGMDINFDGKWHHVSGRICLDEVYNVVDLNGHRFEVVWLGWHDDEEYTALSDLPLISQEYIEEFRMQHGDENIKWSMGGTAHVTCWRNATKNADKFYTVAIPADAEITHEWDDGYCKHGKYVGGMGVDWMCHYCEMGYTDEEWEALGVDRAFALSMKAYHDEIIKWVLSLPLDKEYGLMDGLSDTLGSILKDVGKHATV